jgi:hypothetical protein
MPNDLAQKVSKLDDKHAIFVAQSLSKALFTKVTPPSSAAMAGALDASVNPANFGKATFEGPQAAAVARAVLGAWAVVPELAPAVELGIERFKPSKQDLGILSVPVALGLTYALLSMDLDVDLGFVKVKKKGLSGKQQAEIIKTSLSPVLKAIRAFQG